MTSTTSTDTTESTDPWSDRRSRRNPRRRAMALSGQRALLSLTGLLLVALSAGCSGSGEAESGTGSGEDQVVRLLTYDSFALADETAEAFREQTGASIEVVQAGDSGAMLAGALLNAGSPEADVIFGIDNTTAAEAAEDGFLVAYRPDAVGELSDDLDPPAEVVDTLTPIDTSEVCVNVDRGWYESEGIAPPESFEDLTLDRYRDHLVVENPVNSSPGMAFMLGSIELFGDEGWTDYWQRLRDNGARVSPSWDDAYYNDYTVSGGDRPLVVSYASSPPAEVVFGEGAVDEPSSGVLEQTCVSQVEYAGILAGAENPELARELLDFMLSDQWQQSLPLANFVYPVTDVELPEEFRKWAPRPEDPIVVDAEAVADHRDEWLEQWRSTME